MSRARQVIPEQFYLVTRRCTQRQFLLRPDPQTNNAFVYCLVEAALRFDIDVVLTTAESNHHHTVIFDRHGRYPLFLEHFHKMFARCQNARLGRRENLWAAEEPCVTRLLDRATVLDKLVYVASNPVKDHLVECAVQWPGTNGYRQLLSRKPLFARRPHHFFDANGSMPPEVTLPLEIPRSLGAPEDVVAELRDRVTEVEVAMREQRARTGRRIVGRGQILKQPWSGSPTTVQPRARLRPRFAGATDVRVAALVSFREFLADYRNARLTWISGGVVQFPPGTFWLARFAPISVAPLRTN
jgi:putative transposase